MKFLPVIIFLLFSILSTRAQDRTKYLDTSIYASIRQLIKKVSDSIETAPSAAIYFRRASLEFDIEKWKEAEIDLTQAIASDTSMFLYYYKRGASRDRQGKLSDAYDDYCKAIQLNPGYEWSYLDRGLVCNELKLYEYADKDYRIALKIKPEWSAALFCIGVNFEDRNQVDSAIIYHVHAVSSDPKQYKSFNNLGNIYKNQKQFDLALSYFSSALKIWPAYTIALTNRAETFYLKGDIQDACKDLKTLIDLGRVDKIPAYNKLCR